MQPLLSPSHKHFLWSRLAGTLNELHTPSECLLYPILAPIFSPVAGVYPQMFEAGEVHICSLQERLDPVPVHHLGAVNLRLEHESFRIHQQMALTTFDLLATVVTSVFPAYPGSLYRLAIHNASAGLRVSLQANPKTFSDSPV